MVYIKVVKLKIGVSGGKVTEAILTGRIYLLATRFSRKENNTQAHFDNFDSTCNF